MFRLRAGAIAIAAAAAFVAAPASAAVDLGNLSVASPVSYTQSFAWGYNGSFADEYLFSLNSASGVVGSTSEQDGYGLTILGFTMLKDIDVSSIALAKYDAGTGLYQPVTSTTATAGFNLGTLGGGSYKMTVNGTVVYGDFTTVGTAYNGGVSSYTLTAGTASVAAAAPEASELVMAVLGLAGVGFWARRQKRA